MYSKSGFVTALQEVSELGERARAVAQMLKARLTIRKKALRCLGGGKPVDLNCH